MLALLGAIALVAAPTTVEARNKRRKRVIADGVTFRLYRFPKPNKVRVLTFDPSASPTLDVVLARDKLPGLETTSSMAARTRAIAAINGDYARPIGAPVFTFAQDGRLEQDPERDTVTGAYKYGRNFSMRTDEGGAYFGNPKTRSWFYDHSTNASSVVNRFNNGPPGLDDVSAFSPAGGTAQKPPSDSCYVRLRASGPPATTPAPHAPVNRRGKQIVEVGVEQPYFVEKSECRVKRLNPKGGVTLVADPAGSRALELQSMTYGEEVTLGWSLNWADVFDTIGGNPTLIEDGVIQSQSVDDGSHFASMRAPRTGVGYDSATGRIFLVTVDGRQPRYSVGMNLRQFAKFFLNKLGATDALNLDGGGSTTMVVDGRVKGRPSDSSGERAVSSSLVILPRADSGENYSDDVYPAPPPPAPSATPGTLPRLPARTPQLPDSTTYSLMVQDPASVGGLADYFVRRIPGRALPSFIDRAAQRFRNS